MVVVEFVNLKIIKKKKLKVGLSWLKTTVNDIVITAV